MMPGLLIRTAATVVVVLLLGRTGVPHADGSPAWLASPAQDKGESDKSNPARFDSSKVKVSLEDRVAIYDLFARYSQAIDMGNGDEMVNNVFAPEGILASSTILAFASSAAPRFERGSPITRAT
jgi:hypothetical protein